VRWPSRRQPRGGSPLGADVVSRGRTSPDDAPAPPVPGGAVAPDPHPGPRAHAITGPPGVQPVSRRSGAAYGRSLRHSFHSGGRSYSRPLDTRTPCHSAPSEKGIGRPTAGEIRLLYAMRGIERNGPDSPLVADAPGWCPASTAASFAGTESRNSRDARAPGRFRATMTLYERSCTGWGNRRRERRGNGRRDD
jgi:hypothetical protein